MTSFETEHWHVEAAPGEGALAHRGNDSQFPDSQARRKFHHSREVERVALHLFAEHGYDEVTIADIASAAYISSRTFHRYFATKEEVVLAGFGARFRRVVVDYWGQAPDQPVVLALRHAMSHVAAPIAADGDRMARDRASILSAQPAMAARGLDRFHRVHEELVTVTGIRMGVDPRLDLRPGVIVGAMAGGLRAGWQTAVASRHMAQAPQLMARALDLLVPALTTLVEAAHPGP